MRLRTFSITSLVLLTASFAWAQTVVRSFDGDTGPVLASCDATTQRCARQPEPNAAADGKYVMQVTVNNVNIYDYRGKLLRTTPMRKFVTDSGMDANAQNRQGVTTLGPYEPHVVFNEFIGRWIVAVTCHDDCFIVSATADPLGAWRGISITCLQGGPCLGFDPAMHIGYDKNGVYYCGGHLGAEHPKTVPGAAYDCFAIPNDEVKGIGEGKAPEHINRMNSLPLDILPVVDQDPKKPANAPVIFVSKTCNRAEPGGCQRSKNFEFEWIVDTFTWNGPSGTWNAGGEQLVKTDVGSKQNKWLYNLPCCGPLAKMAQKGSDIGLRAAESHRLINLVQQGTHVYGALGTGPCTENCGAQGIDTNNFMIYLDLDCSNPAACVVSQTGKIGSPDSNPIFGTLGVDNNGNVGVAAISSTADTYASVLLWTRRATDPPNTFSGPTTVVAGTQPYTCVAPNNVANKLALMANAVGISTLRDPRDGAKLWTTQQYGGDATPCIWHTRIFEYQVGGKPPKAAKAATKK